MKQSVKAAGRGILRGAGLVTATAWFCGYTTLRLPPRPRKEKLRVACVGDSLTYGCGVPLFFLRRYPAVLSRLLGEAYQVAVFAVDDRTLQSTGNKPFRWERAFPQSKAFGPDIVVLLLGTNDAKDRNWTSPAALREECAALIREYRRLPTNPRILLCTPPQAFPAVCRLIDCVTGIRQSRIPAIAQAVRDAAAQEGVEWIDLYQRTEHRRELYGPDGLHPSGKGARLLAEAVYEAIMHGADGR